MKFGPINCASGDERLHFQSSRVVEAAINKLMPVGKFHRDDFPGGSITIDQKYLQTMVANWKAMAAPGGEPPDLPIDYFHRGESENDGLSVDAKKAAGWISKLEVRPDGLYAETKWTAAAKALIDADELRYFSPTFHPDMKSHADGKRQGPTLLGGALLNDPYFKELPRLAANEAPNPKDKPMLTLAHLAGLLALSADTATEEQITARIKALIDGEAKAAEMLKAAEGQAGALKSSVESVSASLKATEAKLAAIEAERAEEKVSALIAKLKNEKRIVANEEEGVRALVKGMGLDFATKHYAARTPVVPVGVAGIDTKPEDVPVSTEDALKKFQAIVDEKIKAGAPFSAAHRIAARENPALYAASNANLTAPPKAEA